MSQTKSQSEVIESFIQHKKANKEYTWAETCKRTANRFENYLDLHNHDLTEEEFTGAMLEDFVSYLQNQNRWSNNSINNMVFAVRELLKYANKRHDWDVIWAKHKPNSIYHEDLELPSSSKSQMKEETGRDILYIREDEHEKLISECSNPRDSLLFSILWDTGARPKEIRDLRLRQFKKNEHEKENLFEENKIQVDTAKRDDHQRYIYLKPSTKRKLIYWIFKGEREAYSSCAETSSYVFPTQRSEKFTKGGINKQVKRWAEKAGIQEVMYTKESDHKLRGEHQQLERNFVRINAKSYRHAFAVRSCKNGMSLAVLADLMGHSDPESLKHYTKFYPDDLKEAWEQYTT